MSDSPDCPGCGARLELKGTWWVCPNEGCPRDRVRRTTYDSEDE